MAAMAEWRDYQEQAAAFFRDLGLDATTDERITGARATHRVDVAVRARRVGMNQLWIVECKKWQRPVNKEHVAALSDIVKDVGADRGIMLSEPGFQSGAKDLAARSNITLTSLAALSESLKPEDLSAPQFLRFLIEAIKGGAFSSPEDYKAYRA